MDLATTYHLAMMFKRIYDMTAWTSVGSQLPRHFEIQELTLDRFQFSARTIKLSARARHYESGHLCACLAHGRGLLHIPRLLRGWKLYDD